MNSLSTWPNASTPSRSQSHLRWPRHRLKARSARPSPISMNVISYSRITVPQRRRIFTMVTTRPMNCDRWPLKCIPPRCCTALRAPSQRPNKKRNLHAVAWTRTPIEASFRAPAHRRGWGRQVRHLVRVRVNWTLELRNPWPKSPRCQSATGASVGRSRTRNCPSTFTSRWTRRATASLMRKSSKKHSPKLANPSPSKRRRRSLTSTTRTAMGRSRLRSSRRCLRRVDASRCATSTCISHWLSSRVRGGAWRSKLWHSSLRVLPRRPHRARQRPPTGLHFCAGWKPPHSLRPPPGTPLKRCTPLF